MSEFATSADGTRIAFDRYGSGPAVIFIGGAFQSRALDQATTDLARQLGERGLTMPAAAGSIAAALPDARIQGIPAADHQSAAADLLPVLADFLGVPLTVR